MRRTVHFSIFAGTDNRANDFLSNKRSTTKWPLMLINMQLSSCLAKSRLTLDLRWRPRDENKEADELTNEVFSSFSMSKRVALSFEQLDLQLVNELWSTKLQFDQMREQARQSPAEKPHKGKRKHDKTEW